MNDQPKGNSPPPSPPPAGVAAPRTLVNSSTSVPYVPSTAPPTRAGADDHKQHHTKGMPT